MLKPIPEPDTKKTRFPLHFQRVLALRQLNYTHLSKLMERKGYKTTPQFIQQYGTGRRAVPSLQLKRICEVLELEHEEELMLHQAAARDQGYNV